MSRTEYIIRQALGTVLDIGCAGDRGNLHLKLIEFFDDVHGLDIEEMETEKFVIGDCQELPYDSESFATVIMGEVLEHLVNPLKALKEAYRVLAPDGRIILTVPNAYSWGNVFGYLLKGKEQESNPDHIWLFTPYSISYLLWFAGFTVSDLRIIKPSYRLGSHIAAMGIKLK